MEELFFGNQHSELETDTANNHFNSYDYYSNNNHMNIINDPFYHHITPSIDLSHYYSSHFGPFKVSSPYLTHDDISSMHNAIIPKTMVLDSVKGASDFFHIKDPLLVTEGDSTGVYTLFKNLYFDDVLTYSPEQLLQLGINDKSALDLVMTHEAAHRALQDYKFEGVSNGSWEQELSCDFFAGIRAQMQGIDSAKFTDAMESTLGGDTHPTGSLRADFVQHGQEVAKEMQIKGIEPTFDNCLKALNEHLIEERYDIIAARNTLDESGTLNHQVNGGLHAFANEFKGVADEKMQTYWLDKAKSADEMAKFYTDKGNHFEAKWQIKNADTYYQKAKNA